MTAPTAMRYGLKYKCQKARSLKLIEFKGFRIVLFVVTGILLLQAFCCYRHLYQSGLLRPILWPVCGALTARSDKKGLRDNNNLLLSIVNANLRSIRKGLGIILFVVTGILLLQAFISVRIVTINFVARLWCLYCRVI